MAGTGKFKFAIDRGGTFTDVFAKCPDGRIRVLKLLSEDPQHYSDAPTEGIRRILQEDSKFEYLSKISAKDMRVRWNSLGVNAFRESAIKRKLALTHIRKQIDVLSTFLPDQLLEISPTDHGRPRNFVGVLLFADVSGFTPLCEKYNKTGKGGIYRLTATLNAYIGAIVEVIYFFGGDVLKFSGDAFLAVWRAPPDQCLYEVIHEVIVCALSIQATLGCFETEVNVLLKVKLAIASGNLMFSVIGNDDFRNFVVLGPAVNDVKNAEHVSVPGDVVLAPSAWGHLSDSSYDITQAEQGNVKVWKCVYNSTQRAMKEAYAKRLEIARVLCQKHLAHRSRLHSKRLIDDSTVDSDITEEFVQSLNPRHVAEAAGSTWTLDDMSAFIVPPVLIQVEEKQPIEYLTEMREVTIQFINIEPGSYHEPKLGAMVDGAYQTVCEIVSKVKGVVNKVSLFDKDAMMLVLFGLRGVKHELESQQALKSAYAIREAISKMSNVTSVSIGVTNGLVYCGVVGHPLRKEYTVIGGAVNKAARIMCAYKNKVTCDHVTYKTCKLSSSLFQLQSALKLKGIEDAGHIFEYNEHFDSAIDDQAEVFPIIGRSREMTYADYVINDPKKVENFRGVCFRGDSKVGKSKILNTLFDKYRQEGYFVASANLQTGMQRPYSCISRLYRQLHDSLSDQNSRAAWDLPKDLWSFTEILQDRSGRSTLTAITKTLDRDALYANFIRLCRSGNNGYAVVFIDDMQHLDSRSFEILDSALKGPHVRLIGAGTFEEVDTWDAMWRMSLSDQIKLFDVESLKSSHLINLICMILEVQGVDKKLLDLCERTCEGRPGWVQSCLLILINNGELEVKHSSEYDSSIVFPEKKYGPGTVFVATFSPKYFERTEGVTLQAISLDLFDSFTPYEQLIIKTASVLGVIFSRTILVILLKYPNETMFASAIQNLFDENIFGCASSYINGGGVTEKRNTCFCYMNDEDYRADEEVSHFPRYAFCKLFHFKGKDIMKIAYELLPMNQKKELHLRITDLLETQNNACPNCLRDNSASVISTVSFKDLIYYCNDSTAENNWRYYQSRFDEKVVENIKDVIRKTIRSPSEFVDDDQFAPPKRKVWDPTTCFCIEILSRVYMDLIHHSHCADHLGKKIYFMLQYALISVAMDEFESAIPVLNEARELCATEQTDRYIVSSGFKRLILGKIHIVLSEAYKRIGNIQACKNNLHLALRQYNVPMISFAYKIPNMVLNRILLMRLGDDSSTCPELNNPMIRSDFGFCLSMISMVYAQEGKWDLARVLALRSLSCLKKVNPSIEVLCSTYANAIDLYNYCGDKHICEKLESCLNQELLHQHDSMNITVELFRLTKLICMIFLTGVMRGKLQSSMRRGYRVLEMTTTIQAYWFQLNTLPTLATILIMSQRIDEAVHIAKILQNNAKKSDKNSLIAYYTFCLELILEANFTLETFDKIEKFAQSHFGSFDSIYNPFEYKLIVLLYNHQLRYCQVTKSWEDRYKWDGKHHYTITEIVNLMKATECLLLKIVRNLQVNKRYSKEDTLNARAFLKKCEVMAHKWDVFMPRYLHLKAYFLMIKGKKNQAKKTLKQVDRYAGKQGNLLEQAWAGLHMSCWSGGFSFDSSQVNNVNWKFAKTYSLMQWSQIMYALPYN